MRRGWRMVVMRGGGKCDDDGEEEEEKDVDDDGNDGGQRGGHTRRQSTRAVCPACFRGRDFAVLHILRREISQYPAHTGSSQQSTHAWHSVTCPILLTYIQPAHMRVLGSYTHTSERLLTRCALPTVCTARCTAYSHGVHCRCTSKRRTRTGRSSTWRSKTTSGRRSPSAAPCSSPPSSS
eukprot:1038881-Rhodomonas_salina.1